MSTMLDVGRIGGNCEHLSPDLAYRLVHDCTHRKDLDSGRRLHSLIIQNGLDSAPLLANHLIRLYANCGKLIEANNTFNRLSNPDRYSWNAIIDAHAKLDGRQLFLQLYHGMQNAGISPDKFTFLALLRACNSLLSIEPGRVVHGQILGSYLQSDLVVESSLINIYAKCGNSEEAERILNISRSPNVISWNAMIAGFAQHDQGHLALSCFVHMQLNGVQHNQITLLSILKACGSINGIQHARWIHEQILDSLNGDGISYIPEVNMENTLIDVYAKCGSLEEAIGVFGNLRNKKDVVSWGIMVSGYVENAEYKLALECFEEMDKEGKKPNNVTFIMTLKACCNIIGELQKGKCIHEQVIKCGRQSDLAIGSTLVDMYAKCGDLQEAYGVFCRLKNRNVVSWNSMIAGYVQHEQDHFALECFKNMQYDGIKPDKVTYLSVLKACGSIGSIEKCKYFHEGIIEIGLQYDIAVGSAIVDMYANCKDLDVAYKAFQILPNRNIVTWNAIIAGYARNDEGLLALNCFESMQREGTNPNEYTFSSTLKACSNVGAIGLGRCIHKIIMRSGLWFDLAVENALIDMYANCGVLLEARKVFDRLHNKNLVSWNSMIAGYGRHGEVGMAVQCFEDMYLCGLIPDGTAYCGILTALHHVGFVNEALWYFQTMKEYSGLTPDMRHITCMVDILGHAGLFNKAKDLVRKGAQPDIYLWMTLLCACKLHYNVDLGQQCFEEIIILDPSHAPAYVLMSNIYAGIYLGRYVGKCQTT